MPCWLSFEPRVEPGACHAREHRQLRERGGGEDVSDTVGNSG